MPLHIREFVYLRVCGPIVNVRVYAQSPVFVGCGLLAGHVGVWGGLSLPIVTFDLCHTPKQSIG